MPCSDRIVKPFWQLGELTGTCTNFAGVTNISTNKVNWYFLKPSLCLQMESKMHNLSSTEGELKHSYERLLKVI